MLTFEIVEKIRLVNCISFDILQISSSKECKEMPPENPEGHFYIRNLLLLKSLWTHRLEGGDGLRCFSLHTGDG